MEEYSNKLYDFLYENSDENFRQAFPEYSAFENKIQDTKYVSNLYGFLYENSDDNFRQAFPDVVSFGNKLKKKETSSKDSSQDSSDPKRVLESDLQRGRLSSDALADISNAQKEADRYEQVLEKGLKSLYPETVIPEEGEDLILDGINLSALESMIKQDAEAFGSPAAGMLQRGGLDDVGVPKEALKFSKASKEGLSKSDYLKRELGGVSDIVNKNFKAAGGDGNLIEMDGSTMVGINKSSLDYAILSSDEFQKELLAEEARGIATTLAMQAVGQGGQFLLGRQLAGGTASLGAGIYGWFDSEGAQNYLIRKSARDTGFKKAIGLTDEQIERGIIENFEEGDLEGAFTNLFLTTLEQVPQLAIAAVGGGAGMAALGVSAGGQQYSSLMVNPNVSKGTAVTTGLFLGAAEYAAERLLPTDVRLLRRAAGLGNIRSIFKDKNILKNLGNEGMSLIKSGGEEALEEAIVGTLEQATNSIVLGEPINVYEIADAAFMGFIMGGGVRTITTLPSFIGSMKTTGQIAKLNNEINKTEEVLANAKTPNARQLAQERLNQLREQSTRILTDDAMFYDQMTDEELKEVTSINQKIAQAVFQYRQADTEAEAEVARGVIESELSKKKQIEDRYSRPEPTTVDEDTDVDQTEETVKQALPEQERSPEQIEADRVSSEEVDNVFGQDRSLNNVSERAGRKERINEQEIEDAINDGYDILDEIEANDNLSEQDKATMSELIEDQIETLEGYELQTKTETRKVAKTKTVRTVKKTPRKTEPTREKEFVGAKAVYSDNEGGGGRGVVIKEERPDGKNYYIIETADGQKILLGEESTLFNETTVNRDENGNPVSITTPVGKDGKQVTIKNPEVAGIFDIEQGKQEDFDEQIFEETYIEVVGEEDVEVLSPRPKPTPRPKPQPKKTESEQKTKIDEKVEKKVEKKADKKKDENPLKNLNQQERRTFIRDNAGLLGQKFLNAVDMIGRSLRSVNYDIILLSKEEMANLDADTDAFSADRGAIDIKNKKIFINVQDGINLAGRIKGKTEEERRRSRVFEENAIVRAVYHEGFHALFTEAFGSNPDMLPSFVQSLKSSARATLPDSEAKSLIQRLENFSEQYTDAEKMDEFITEFAALMVTGEAPLLRYPSFAARVRNYLNGILERIGVGFRFTGDDDFIAFMNAAARGLKTGRRVEDIIEQMEPLLGDQLGKSDVDKILDETPETQIKTGPDKIEFAPDGSFVNIGMVEGRTEETVSEQDVINALPEGIVKKSTFISVDERDADGEPLVFEDTMSIELNRPLTNAEMLSLRKDLLQLAVPQIVDGDASMFGQDFGEFDPQYFVMLDKKRLSELDPKLKKSKRLLAPNGQPSNLNEVQHRIVRTPQFKNWFGDWENDPENASKALDENGEPLVLYHGTNDGRFIDESGVFARQRNRLGFRNYFPFRTPIQLNENQGLWFFTDDPKVAETYMKSERNVGRRLVPAFLSIKNPLIVDAKGDKFSVAQFPLPPEGKEPLNIFQQAIKDQNDAVIINNVKDDFTAEVLTNTYTVFESNQIKLADGSNTTFDSDDLDIRKSKRVGLEAVSESPSNIDQAFEMAKTTPASVNVEFKDELQDIFNTQTKRIMAQEYGVKDFSTAKGNEPLKRYLVDAYLAEVLTAVENYPQALGWYDAKTKAAMDIMSTIHPELATDVDALNLFKIAVAITSNGNKVDQNFKEADRVYRYYKENGEFDTKRSLGTQSSAIKASFRLVNKALQKMTVAEFTEFLTTKMRAGELSYRAKDGKKPNLVSGHTVDTEVYGASIFGPKIGNGFFMNLYGAYEMLTMDRWFIRTYGRLTGTLIQRDKAAIRNARARLKNGLQALSVAERKVLRDVIGPYSKLNLSEIAKLVNSKSTKEDLRAIISKGKLNEVRLAGNGLVTKEKGEVEAPRGGENRNFIKSVFDEVQQRLKEENDLDITMADIQAVIWYPEKALYEEYKKGKKVDKKSNESKDKDAEQPDYENAAEKLAKEFNITQKQIDDARGSKPTGKLDGRRAGQRGGDDARKAQVKEEIIKAKAGNKFDRLLEEAKTRKSKRVGLTTLEGRGKQITTTLNEDRPIGVIPIPERYMKGFNERPLTEKEKNSPLYEIGQKFPYKKGGVYVDARDKSSPMDSYVASSGKIFIDLKSGFPKMGVSENEAEPVIGQRASKGVEGTKIIRSNLFKMNKGWSWKQASKGLKENVKTIVSVETGNSHIYTLGFESTTPLELKNYGDKPSEPRLRPTTAGSIFLGTQVGEIEVRGKTHPVFEQVISYDPNDPSIVERLAYSQSKSDQEFNQQYYDRFNQKPLRNPTDDLFKDVDKYVLKMLGFEGAKHIGNGVEANVYDIGGGRVIRIAPFPSPLLNSLTGKSIDGLVKVYSTGRVEFPKNLISKRIPKFVNFETEQLGRMKRKQQQMKKLPVGYYSIMKKESTEGVEDDLKDLFFKISDFLSMRGFRGGHTFTNSLFRPRSKWQLETRPELQLNEEEMQELRESLTEQQVKDLDRFLQIDKNARAAGIQLYDTHYGNFARDSEGSLVALDLDTALDGEIKAEEKTVLRKAKRVSPSFDRATEKRTENHAKDPISGLERRRNKISGIRLVKMNLFDRQSEVRRLIRKSGNKILEATLSTRLGSSANAKLLFEKASKEIFEGVFGNKLKYISEVIKLRRIISIEASRPSRIAALEQKIREETSKSAIASLRQDLKDLKNFKHPDNLTAATAQDELDEIRRKINNDEQFFDIRNRADKYFDVMRDVLQRKLDEGLINQETYDVLSKFEYSPRIFISKMFDLEGGNITGINESTFRKGYGLSEAEFKRMKSGSTEALYNDAEFLLRMVLATSESRVFANRFYKELAKSTNLSWVSKRDRDGFRELKYKDKGEVKSIFVQADLADQIEFPNESIPKSNANQYLQWFMGSKILRAMATGYNPMFPISNVPMDFMNIIFFTDVYDNNNVFTAMGKLGKQFGKNALGLRAKNPNTMAMLEEALDSGMGMDFLSNQGRLKFDKKPKQKAKALLRGSIDLAGSFSENSELAMRLAVYQKVKAEQIQKGESEQDARTIAAFKARATIDFSQGGTVAKAIDTVVPYFNASLQGLRVAGGYTARNPKKFGGKLLQVGSAVTLFTLLFRIAADAFGWDDEDIDAISPHDKNNYLTVPWFTKDKEGNREYLRIRKNPQLAPFLKPFEFAGDAMYMALNGKSFEDIKKEANRSLAEMANQINDATIFGDVLLEVDMETLEPKVSPMGVVQYMPPFIKAAAQYKTGYDFFREKNISPDKMKVDMGDISIGSEGMEDPRVFEFYKKMSESLMGTPFEFSPARAENFVETIITSPSTNLFVATAYGILDGGLSLDALEEAKTSALRRMIRSANKKYKKVTLDPSYIRQKQAENAMKNKVRYKIGNMVRVDGATKEEVDSYINTLEDPKLQEFARKRYEFNKKTTRWDERILQDKNKYEELEIYMSDDKVYAAQFMFEEFGDLENDDLREIAGYIEEIRGTKSFKYPKEFMKEYRRLQKEAR